MNTLILVKPSEEYIDEICAYRQSFIDYVSQFNGDSGLRKYEDIAEWIKQCRLMENKDTIPNPALVEAEQFMLIHKDTKQILGMINFRHYLNDYLAEYAGHIGYGVCPTERKKGYAKTMLTLCLEKCRERGLDKVLITCDESNEASRRTILTCGGVFDRKTTEGTEVLERYWIMLKGKESPIAYCGLACCVCSKNDKCVGCQNGGCDTPDCHCCGDGNELCDPLKCLHTKDIDNCFDCADYPCEKSTVGYKELEHKNISADDVTWAILPYVPYQYED